MTIKQRERLAMQAEHIAYLIRTAPTAPNKQATDACAKAHAAALAYTLKEVIK